MQAIHSTPTAGASPITRLFALSAGLWAIGAITIHMTAPFGLFAPLMAPILLAATLPLAWLTVRLANRLGGLPLSRLMETVTLVSVPALLLDGIGLSFIPTFYSVNPTEQRVAAAWLLWFVGVSLAIAVATSAGNKE